MRERIRKGLKRKSKRIRTEDSDVYYSINIYVNYNSFNN